MQYNEPPESEMLPEKPLDDYFDGSEHSTFRNRKTGYSMKRLFSRTDLPMILIGVIILVLVVFLIVVAMSSSDSDGDIRIADLENRSKTMEEQIAKLVEENSQLKLIELQEKKLSLLIDRVGRLEGEIALTSRHVEKKPEPPKSKPKIETPPKAKPATAKKPIVSKKAAARTHHVRAGETMFGIAKQYGLSVAALQRLNPSLKGNDIFPGQQLKVAAH